MSRNNKDFFWLSYADLMTSLFFIMLVLFVLVFSIMQYKSSALENELKENRKILSELEDANNLLKVKAFELDKINEIKASLENIDKEYFIYNPEYKKHILNIDVGFKRNSFNMFDMDEKIRTQIRNAGISLETLMKSLSIDEQVQYLLVIEGQASKDGAIINDELSYKRAIALRNFWFGLNPNLNNVLPNCEVIIAGSGQYGVPRIIPDIPPANQRFLITIVPKIGEIENND